MPGKARADARAETRQLLGIIDNAFDRRSWHGTNLRGAIRRVTARQAAWRPAGSAPRVRHGGQTPHNIWELVVHAAYWKYIALRRLTGGRRGSFPLKGSDWFARDGASGERGWREDIALLERMHRSLREVVAALSDRDLGRRPPGSTVTTFALLSGVAAHDLYHAGQIQLLKRLQQRT